MHGEPVNGFMSPTLAPIKPLLTEEERKSIGRSNSFSNDVRRIDPSEAVGRVFRYTARLASPRWRPRDPSKGKAARSNMLDALRQDSCKCLAVEEVPYLKLEQPPLEEVPPATEDDDGMTVVQAGFSIANLLVGVGMLSMPYAMASAGGILGFGIISAAACAMTFTASLIGVSLVLARPELDKRGVKPHQRDFAALADIAYGPAGRALIGTMFVLEQWCAFEAFLVVFATNLHELVGTSQVVGITVCLALSFALLFTSSQALSAISFVSVGALLFALVALLTSGLHLPGGEAAPAFEEYHHSFDPNGSITALGLALFSFAGHPALPSVYCQMRNPERDFPPAVSLGLTLCTAFYLSSAIVGYYFFGDFSDQVFTSNLGRDLHGHRIPNMGFLTHLTAVGFVVKIQGGAPLILAPISAALEGLFGIEGGGTRRYVLLSTLAAVSWFMAVAYADQVAFVAAVSGNVMVMGTSVIFPTALYLRIGGQDQRPAFRALVAFVGCCGVAFAGWQSFGQLLVTIVQAVAPV